MRNRFGAWEMRIVTGLWEDGVGIQDNATSFCLAFPMSYALDTSEFRHAQSGAYPIYIKDNV